MVGLEEVGVIEGPECGLLEGILLGDFDGSDTIGASVGSLETGFSVGEEVGEELGSFVVGEAVGNDCVGPLDGISVG